MLQAVVTGVRRAELVDVTMPTPVAGEVLVRVEMAPLCVEFKRFVAGDSRIALGHEAVGEVVEAPANPELVGRRVVVMPLRGCRSCPLCISGNYIYCEDVPLDVHGGPVTAGYLAEYVVVPAWLAVPIPDDISSLHAGAAGCALGASFGALRRLSLEFGDTLLVTGLGPVGLGAVVNARHQGAHVIAVEPNSRRGELGQELGAEVYPDVHALTEAIGRLTIDAAVECSGSATAQRLCIDVVRRLGRIGFVAESDRDLPIQVSRDLLRKGLTLQGSWHYNLADAERLLNQIRRLGAELDMIITHQLPLAELQSAFELQALGDSGKVVIHIR